MENAYQTPSYRPYAEITCSDFPERMEVSADVRDVAVRLYPTRTSLSVERNMATKIRLQREVQNNSKKSTVVNSTSLHFRYPI
jgi:hypothetical protein